MHRRLDHRRVPTDDIHLLVGGQLPGVLGLREVRGPGLIGLQSFQDSVGVSSPPGEQIHSSLIERRYDHWRRGGCHRHC